MDDVKQQMLTGLMLVKDLAQLIEHRLEDECEHDAVAQARTAIQLQIVQLDTLLPLAL